MAMARLSGQEFKMLEAFSYDGWGGMRNVVSNLTDDYFNFAIARLVESDYIEGIGVFPCLGRAAPVLTYGDQTRLTESGKRAIGRWEDGSNAAVSNMDFSNKESVSGPCVVCGIEEGTKPIFKARPWLTVFDEDGTKEIRILPPIVLCDSHRMPVALGEIIIGWCEELSCRRWGVEGRKSPCGRRFREIPDS
jgi:hypothetical protein